MAIGLGLDAFSVALGVGSRLGRANGRQIFRLSFHFGLFQFLMPLAGWAIGHGAMQVVEAYNRWIAFAILVAVGLHMIIESFRPADEARIARDPTRGWSLVGLSVATSLDALGVGVGLGVLGRRLFRAAIVIGLVAAGMTLVGLRAGGVLRQAAGRRMEAVGGGVLVALGIRMLMHPST